MALRDTLNSHKGALSMQSWAMQLRARGMIPASSAGPTIVYVLPVPFGPFATIAAVLL